MDDLTPRDDDDMEIVIEPPERLGPPVDPTEAPRAMGSIIGRRDERRAIIPAAVRTAQQRRDLAAWSLRYAGHTAAYHATRGPKYAAKVAFWAPIGVVASTGRLLKWASAEEGNYHLRQQAANSNDPDTWIRLDRHRQGQARWRWWVAGLIVALVGIASLVLTLAPVPWWSQWLAITGGVTVFARLGRPADKPITDRVSLGNAFIKLTADMTRAALVACGAGIKKPEDVKFPRDIYRDPPGWTAVVNLPPGVIAMDVIDKRDRLAAGFRLPKQQVWPAPVDGAHPGQLQIWVADQPVSSMRAPAWPLLARGTVDYFKPFVYGFDERMRPVTWSFDQKNSLAAGIPGSGKSLSVRVILLAGVLDPLVIPVVFELKGTGDYDMVEPMCPRGLYGSGADEGTKHRAMAALEWLLDECERRGPLVKQAVARGLSKTNNVNRAMSEQDERLRPILAVFDEVQELFTDPELGKSAKGMATSIIKRGRALGIHIVLATQRIDKESIPRGISSNVAVRLCLAVTSHVECDMVLGTGAHGRGARPTEFETATDGDPKDSGWGWRAGLGRMAPVRSAYLDNDQAKAVAVRAMEARGAAPEVEEPERVRAYNLLADVRRVWIEGEEALWSELIVPRLATLRPEIYGEWDVRTFGAAMKAAGIATQSVHRKLDGAGQRHPQDKGWTKYGVKLSDLTTALSERSKRPEIED